MTGDEFRARRKALGKGVTQEALAAWFGVEEETIRRLENTEGQIERFYAFAMRWTCEHAGRLKAWTKGQTEHADVARVARAVERGRDWA